MIVYEQTRRAPVTLQGGLLDTIKGGIDTLEKKIGDSAENSKPPEWMKGSKIVGGSAAKYVKTVGEDLVRQVRSSRKDFGYKFTVIDSPVINAWAWPNGSIYITTALLSKLRSRDALAAVLGHEVVHAAEHHGLKKVGLGTATQAGILALAKQFFGKLSEDDLNTYAGLVYAGMNNSYGRGTEEESDWRGQRMAARAGYSPKGAAELMDVFLSIKKKEPNLVERLLATHPYSGDRLKAAQGREKEYADISRVDVRTGRRSEPSVGSYANFLVNDLHLSKTVAGSRGDSDISLGPLGMPKGLEHVITENVVPLLFLGGAIVVLGVVLLWK
jgi:hypothetical protein